MKLIILGSGSSIGSPWITNNWGKCNKNVICNGEIYNFKKLVEKNRFKMNSNSDSTIFTILLPSFDKGKI